MRQWVAVTSAGPYASLHLTPDIRARFPPLSFLQAGCPSCCPANSVKALNRLLSLTLMRSVLWHCWLGIRKRIRPIKKWVIRWSVWSEVQIVCISTSWCHCIPKLHHLLPHLNPVLAYQVVLEKRPFNGYSSSSSSNLFSFLYFSGHSCFLLCYACLAELCRFFSWALMACNRVEVASGLDQKTLTFCFFCCCIYTTSLMCSLHIIILAWPMW